jgi:hypothetical protein
MMARRLRACFAFAPGAATACAPGQLSREDEPHQPFGVEIKLPVKPRFARGSDVGSVALGSVRGFF